MFVRRGAVVPWCRGAVKQVISRHFHVYTPMVESYGVGMVYQLVGTYVETDFAGTKYKLHSYCYNRTLLICVFMSFR